MCDDYHAGATRRQFLGGTVAALVTPALLSPTRAAVLHRLPLRSMARPQTPDGTSAYSMAMHIHSSFSEFTGSMDSQLYQAAANAVDVLWWSEHQGRLNGLNYRDVVHFTSLTTEKGGPGQGGAWQWQPVSSGSLASSGAGIVQTPCSPGDPVYGGALHVIAKTKTKRAAKHGFYANSQTAAYNYHCTLQGQSLTIDVLLRPGWNHGHLEILLDTSYHQASGGRPAGLYSLSYQIQPGVLPRRAVNGTTGVVHVRAGATGKWHTITITPQNDLAALFPDLDSRDFALSGITLSAVSTGDAVEGYFDYLRFHRAMSGEATFQTQPGMMTALAAKYPSVRQQQGLEISQTPSTTHVNWFGPGVHVGTYAQMTAAQWDTWLQETAIPQIHTAGGLASYNHPFGVGHKTLTHAQMNAELQRRAAALLPTAALGVDLMEVGYPLRGGVDLAHHAGLWDVMSRNGIFLTGNGVSDDHIGEDWYGDQNNWVTSVWATSDTQFDLLAALAAGRAWCSALSRYALPSGAYLDMLADGICPMGSVSVSSVTSRQVTLTAAGLPSGGSVQLLQGVVDYAGIADLSPSTQVIARFTAADLDRNRQVTWAVNTRANTFVRTQVLDSTGTTVALSNPLWMLRNPPPAGIPAPRQA